MIVVMLVVVVVVMLMIMVVIVIVMLVAIEMRPGPLVVAAMVVPDAEELSRDQPEAEQRHQRVGDDADPVGGIADGGAGEGEARRHDADQDDRDQRLQHRRDEAEDDAAPELTLVGENVGRDHHLAVTGPRGVEDAVEEAQRAEHPERVVVGLEPPERRR